MYQGQTLPMTSPTPLILAPHHSFLAQMQELQMALALTITSLLSTTTTLCPLLRCVETRNGRVARPSTTSKWTTATTAAAAAANTDDSNDNLCAKWQGC